jgi:8-oxo-dGTP diphosphatase
LELQQLYEYAFNTTLDKANFRKKLKAIPLIQLNESQQNVKHRPAKLFKYDASAYISSDKNEGFQFNL